VAERANRIGNEMKKQLPEGTPKPMNSNSFNLVHCPFKKTKTKVSNYTDYFQWWEMENWSQLETPNGPNSVGINDKESQPVVT